MKSLKTMLLGIALILFGCFAMHANGTWLGGVGLVTPFFGLVLCFRGWFKNSDK